MLACLSGRADLKSVERVIESGAPLNQRDKRYGATALHYAVTSGREDIAHLLLDQPVIDPAVRTIAGQSPLMLAEAWGQRSRASPSQDDGA